MNTLGFKNIYIDHIYLFSLLFYLFKCLMNDAYVQICINKCKCILCCTSMLLLMRKVALDSVHQSQLKFI